MSNINDIERELGWDDTITNDDNNYTPLPDGKYDFEVVSFERAQYEGSDKIPRCNQADVKLKIMGEAGNTTITEKFKLHTKMEWLLCAFYTSIGMRKKGEPLKMNWPATIGKKGRCIIYTRKWKKTDGSEGNINSVKEYLEPAEPQLYTAGKF